MAKRNVTRIPRTDAVTRAVSVGADIDLNPHEIAAARSANDRIGAAARKIGFLRSSYLEAEQAAYGELRAARLELRKATEAALTSRGLGSEGTWEYDFAAGELKRR